MLATPPPDSGDMPSPNSSTDFHRLLPRRRLRANPRVVKRKYTKRYVKRAEYHNWPQPTRATAEAEILSLHGTRH